MYFRSCLFVSGRDLGHHTLRPGEDEGERPDAGVVREDGGSPV